MKTSALLHRLDVILYYVERGITYNDKDMVFQGVDFITDLISEIEKEMENERKLSK